MLLTIRARRRALAAWLDRARVAWRQIGRLYLAAFAAELDGHGEPGTTYRLRLAFARCHRYVRRCEAALGGA